MTAMTAAEFESAVDWTYYAAKSLSSCVGTEVVRESQMAQGALDALMAAQLKRKNARLEARRQSAVSYARGVLRRRGFQQPIVVLRNL